MHSTPRALPERTWWIEEGRLLGGAYPGAPEPRAARARLEALLDAGVSAFANLMEPDETDRAGRPFAPYEPQALNLAAQRGIEIACARFPIVDVGVPSVARMREILAWLDAQLALDRLCYVHCWGGRGRTGTVAGVHLIRRGIATSATFVDVIRANRRADAGGGSAPETAAQCAFVRDFAREAISARAPA